ncbi:hypothetical protein BZA77DRAFT_64487 [Pyronema omphalodes]|nr:hypothetical protein BZA77DRAFT_64487 [Pyronema omphalodes]
MKLTVAAAALTFILPSVVFAADFGSCAQENQCGFICCAPNEKCIMDYCIPPDFVKSAIAGDAAASIYPSLADDKYLSSVISAIESAPSGVESAYSKFADVMTGAPSPTPLGTTVPSGYTIPSSFSAPVPTGSSNGTNGTTTTGPIPIETSTGGSAQITIAMGAIAAAVVGAIAAL